MSKIQFRENSLSKNKGSKNHKNTKSNQNRSNKSSMLKSFFKISFLSGLFISIWVGIISVFFLFQPNESLTKEMDVKVQSGAIKLYNQLTQDRLIKDNLVSHLIFRFAMLDFIPGKLQKGVYTIKERASLFDIIIAIKTGKLKYYDFQILEGSTVQDVMNNLKNNEILTGEATLKPKEGFLMPDTYKYTYGETKNSIIKRSQDVMQEFLGNLTKDYDFKKLKNYKEILTLASIVENETPIDEEKPTVASVYLNRLEKGIRLQADPTVSYQVTGGKYHIKRVRHHHLFDKGPYEKYYYNTYRKRGLPVAPISNPGRKAIEAVLRPRKTNYYYFVADGNGGHDFSKTFSEHNIKAQSYRKLLDQMGVK